MKNKSDNFSLFFIDGAHREAYKREGNGDPQALTEYEKREPGYFRTMKQAFETHADKINPKHLSYEDFINLHQGLTSHLHGIEMVNERFFSLNALTADENGIKEALENLKGEDFLEARILGDFCIYQIAANGKINRLLPYVTKKGFTLPEATIDLLKNVDNIQPYLNPALSDTVSETYKIELRKANFEPHAFEMLDFNKLDEKSKALFKTSEIVDCSSIVQRVVASMKSNKLGGTDLHLNINKSPEQTQAELKAILEEYNEAIKTLDLSDHDPEKRKKLYNLVGRTMKNISQLHPFPDGNGRTTYVLANLIFIKLGHEPFYSAVQSIFDMNSDERILELLLKGQENFKTEGFTLPTNAAYTKQTNVTEEMYLKLSQNIGDKHIFTIAENMEERTRSILCKKDEFNKFYAKISLKGNIEEFLKEIGLDSNHYHASSNYIVIPREICDKIEIKDQKTTVIPEKEILMKEVLKKINENSLADNTAPLSAIRLYEASKNISR